MMQMYPSNSVGQQDNTIVNDLPKVGGSQDARAQLTRPSTRDVFWDRDENYFYMRVTDVTGKIIDFKRFSYKESPEPTMEDMFVSKEQFESVTNDLKGGILDVQQSIQKLVELQQSANQSGEQSNNQSRTGGNSRRNK